MKHSPVARAVTWGNLVSLVVVFSSAATVTAAEPSPRWMSRSKPADTVSDPHTVARPSWIDLFDGNTLKGWVVTNFGGEGQVHVEDGRILFEFGQMLTGITYQGDFPKSNYEIRFEAMRVDGIDFFCGLTFPVGATHCTLIAGGWAGAVVGLSCIDGKDASENETTQYMTFTKGRWYRFRVRVTDQRIAAWIDGQQVIDQPIRGHRFSIRPEMELSKPLGFAAWQSRGALRGLAYRRLE